MHGHYRPIQPLVQVLALKALFVVATFSRVGGHRSLRVDFGHTGGLKLPIKSGDVRGLELLPEFQDRGKILFRRLDGRYLCSGRSGIGAVEFSIQASDSPARTAKRGQGRSGRSKTSRTASATENGFQLLFKS